MTNFLKDIIKNSGNEYAGIASEGIDGTDVTGFINTGSYAFNALLSGSLYGGIASNKIIALGGESATGKTYFALGMVNKFLNDNPEGVILYFDTESAVTSEMMTERGIDSNRVAIFPVATVESFRHQAIGIVDKYIESGEKKPILMVLDSLGMLSTEKEMELIGVVKYVENNKLIKKNTLVGFTPNSEYEFIIDNERLYRVPIKSICIKYERQGHEKEYNPSWT